MEKKTLGKKISTGNYFHQEVRQKSVAKVLAAVLPYNQDIHRKGKKSKSSKQNDLCKHFQEK